MKLRSGFSRDAVFGGIVAVYAFWLDNRDAIDDGYLGRYLRRTGGLVVRRRPVEAVPLSMQERASVGGATPDQPTSPAYNTVGAFSLGLGR